jgi:hypothetical protein
MRRIALAAVNAAFDQQQEAAKKSKRSHLPATRALLIGAGLMTVGRVALSARGRGLLDSLEERLAVFEGRDGDADLPPEEDEEFENEESDEPEAEGEPDAYDEEEDEPEDYQEEDEPQEYEDEDPEDYEVGYEDEDDYEGDDEEQEEEIDERRQRTTAGSRRRRRS